MPLANCQTRRRRRELFQFINYKSRNLYFVYLCCESNSNSQLASSICLYMQFPLENAIYYRPPLISVSRFLCSVLLCLLVSFVYCRIVYCCALRNCRLSECDKLRFAIATSTSPRFVYVYAMCAKKGSDIAISFSVRRVFVIVIVIAFVVASIQIDTH